MIEEPVVTDDGVCTHPDLYVAAVETPDGTVVCLMCPLCRHAWPGLDLVVESAGVGR